MDGGVYSLAMLSALNCGLYQEVPRIADRARREGVSLTEASYTILIQVGARLWIHSKDSYLTKPTGSLITAARTYILMITETGAF